MAGGKMAVGKINRVEDRLTICLSSALKEKVAKEAKKQNRSISNMVHTILEEYFKQQKR